MTAAQDHDAYIAQVPGDAGDRLRTIHDMVVKLAPQAEAIISYRMPAFRYRGRILIYFSAFRQHTGIFPPLHPHDVFDDIRPFMGPKGNFQFPHKTQLPVNIIRRLVTLRMAENEAPR